MNELENPLQNFKKNLEEVDQLINIGTEVGNLSVKLLEKLLKQNEELSGFIPYKKKLSRTIEVIKEIKRLPQFTGKYEIVYAQSLVLIVANFESFLNEVAVTVFNDWQFLVEWPDKKISLDLSVFKYYTPTTGELVLRSLKDKYNFQDLQSTKEFLKEYFAIEIESGKELEEKIILYQAQRHLIIHNLGKVDDRYLKQIRNTEHFSQYSEGKTITVSEKDYQSARESFIELGDLINTSIVKKINEMMPF